MEEHDAAALEKVMAQGFHRDGAVSLPSVCSAVFAAVPTSGPGVLVLVE